MNRMKNIYIILGLIILGAAAYFVFMQPAAGPSLGMPAPGNEGNYPEPQNKLNIDTICTEALAYMSFPNGAEAEAWVEACKRGEHPEAIEQWKQMNGITDDRAI
jgi:hypothetical protein